MADLKISALTASTTPLAGTEVLPIVQSSTTKQVSVANLTAGRAVATSSVSTTAGYTFRAADASAYELLRYAGGSNNPGLFAKVDEATRAVTLVASGSSSAGQILRIGAEAVEDVLRVSKDDVTVAYGNLIIGTSGKGIDFSATPGTGTSELLADYEEGTWTPTVAGDGTAGTATYSNQVARYTKIGSRVFFACRLVWTGGTGTGAIRVNGLPYTSASITDNFLDVCSIIPNDIGLTALNYAVAYVFNNTAFIAIEQAPVGGGATSSVTYDAAGSLNISGSYLV